MFPAPSGAPGGAVERGGPRGPPTSACGSVQLGGSLMLLLISPCHVLCLTLLGKC